MKDESFPSFEEVSWTVTVSPMPRFAIQEDIRNLFEESGFSV
jgi:hypothetical protein